MENLTPAMKERLLKWRKNTLEVKSAEKIRGKHPGNFISRRKDHGDDLSEFYKDTEKFISSQLQRNKIFEGFK